MDLQKIGQDAFNQSYNAEMQNLDNVDLKPFVQWFSQRNNPDAGGCCEPTSVFGAITYDKFGRNGQLVPENADADFVANIIKRDPRLIGRYHNYQVYQWYVDYLHQYPEFGYNNCEVISDSGTFEKIKRILDQGRAVPIGTRLTLVGHVTLAVGYSKIREGLKINDSWGKYPYNTPELRAWKEPYFQPGYDWIVPGCALDIK